MINGIAAGCVLLVKFSLMGFWVGWIVILLGRIAPQTSWRSPVRMAGAFAGGVAIATIPWLAYFQLHGAVYDFLEVYFHLNLTAYATPASGIERLTMAITSLMTSAKANPALTSLVVLGCLGPLIWRGFFHGDHWARIAMPLLCAGLAVSVYAGGRSNVYYFLAFAPLAITGLAFCAWCIHGNWAPSHPWVVTLSMTLTASLLWYTTTFNANQGMRKIPKADLVQYKWAHIINQASDKSLLNFGWLDIGLHTMTDTLPATRFFFKSNIPDERFPTAREQQQDYVRQRATEFVVATTAKGHEDRFPIDSLIPEHYILIADETQLYENVMLRHLLFQRTK